MESAICKSSFIDAFEKTMINEGGYVNDMDDAGGETYKGISRKFNPDWYGWEIIDFHRYDPYFPKSLDDSLRLKNEVASFFKDKYWNINCLDEFSQEVAEEMFDTGVNLGVLRAAKFLQRSLNYLNRNGELFDELEVDGKIGKKTLSALNSLSEKGGDEKVLVKMLNTLQGQHYMDYMDGNSKQKKYARGWFKRVTV